MVDGDSHKQWYLERVIESLGVNLKQLKKDLKNDDYEWEPGIPP
jgi:hypothetical protein